MSYAYVMLVVILNVYSQLIIKWRVSIAGPFPDLLIDKIWFLGKLSISPWIVSAFAAIFLGFIAWAVALTKLELSKAYPLTSLTFVLVMVGGAVVFNESLNFAKISGLIFIIGGIILVSRS
ncbi:EamA family transporter [Polaromonas sp. YR568]|uniref:EamA family transporter n=1 Tax=Polaromonas sp. YR568 TaxID=1855301 RepID=UPI003137E8F0